MPPLPTACVPGGRFRDGGYGSGNDRKRFAEPECQVFACNGLQTITDETRRRTGLEARVEDAFEMPGASPARRDLGVRNAAASLRARLPAGSSPERVKMRIPFEFVPGKSRPTDDGERCRDIQSRDLAVTPFRDRQDYQYDLTQVVLSNQSRAIGNTGETSPRWHAAGSRDQIDLRDVAEKSTPST